MSVSAYLNKKSTVCIYCVEITEMVNFWSSTTACSRDRGQRSKVRISICEYFAVALNSMNSSRV